MVLFVDTNVLIDYLGRRPEYYNDARSIIEFCSRADTDGYIAFHSVPNAWFILRKQPEKERREGLKEVCTILSVVGAEQSKIIEAIEQTDFKDFEDCLQDKCAQTVHADYIVTRNVKDFQNAETKVITPAEFVKKYIDKVTK